MTGPFPIGFSSVAGMDVEAVRAMAASINHSAETASGRVASDYQSVREVNWTGPDRDRYLADWDEFVAGTAQAFEHQLRDFAERALRNAEEQEQASSGSGGREAEVITR